MTADLITYFNTRLQPLIDPLPIPVRVVGLVRTVEVTEGKKTKKFPMPADESDPVPVLPDSGLGLLLYWEQIGKVATIGVRPSRNQYRATARLVAWYDTRRLVTPSGDIKSLLTRYLHRYLIGTPFNSLPEGVQVLKLKPGDTLGTRTELFSAYTFDNEAAQYVTLPYDAVGLDFTLTWWLNHACLPQINGAAAATCP